MLPNREGRFKASILEHGVAETGPNHLATFIAKFGLSEELVNGEFVPLGPEDTALEITGYFYLEKKDGSINSVTVDQLKSAFGWDGRDPLWLQDVDFSQHTVQVKLEFEEYEGRHRLKVRYVDAADAEGGGVPKADDNVRRALSTRLGSKLRALAGGSPANAPKPNGKPVAPQPKPVASPAKPTAPPAVASPASPARTATMQQAWEAMCQHCPDAWGPKDKEAEWFRLLGQLFPGKNPQQISGAEWANLIEQAPSLVCPL